MVGARAGVGSDKRTIDAWHSGGPPLGNFSAAVRRLLLLTGCTIDRRTPPASRAPAAARAMAQIARFVPGGAFVSFPLVPLSFSLLSSFGHSLDRSLPWIPQQAPARGLNLSSAVNCSLGLQTRRHMYGLPTYTPASCKFSFCEVLLIMTVCGWKCAKNTQFSTHETHLLFSASWPEWGEQ